MSVKCHRDIGLKWRYRCSVPICASCGQDNPDGFRFCGNCGAELAETSPSREVRKTVTVLFSDVFDSTSLGERLDPESTPARAVSLLRHVLRGARTPRRHRREVHRRCRHGDFGVPVAHEDDALRASLRRGHAGCEGWAQRGARAGWGVRLECRIGVNTGEVVVGEGQTLAVGHPVDVATRLEPRGFSGRDAARRVHPPARS